MADLSIPGVNGQYDKLIEAIMKAERLPREKESSSLETFKGQLSYWQALNQFGSQVKDVARSFYSFNNPFNELLASSSNEASFTATATRDAKEQVAKISIKQIATADSFLSDEIAKDTKIEKGRYVFVVGERRLELDWKGGNYKSFMQAINRRGKGFLSVSEIKVSPKTTALLFTSLLTGEKNKLLFEDDALSLAKTIGIVKNGEASKEVIERSNIIVPPFQSDEVNLPLLAQEKNASHLEITFILGNPRKQASDARQAQLDDESKKEVAEHGKNGKASEAGKNGTDVLNNEKGSKGSTRTFEAVGSVAYQGIVVKNNPSDTSAVINIDSNNSAEGQTEKKDLIVDEAVVGGEGDLIDKKPRSEGVSDQDNQSEIAENSSKPGDILDTKTSAESADTDDKTDLSDGTTSPNVSNSEEGIVDIGKNLKLFSIKTRRGHVLELEGVKDSSEKQTIITPLESVEDISSLLLNNDNDVELRIESVKFITKSFEQEHIASHPASIAQDAIVLYQGIEMKRETNSISDIIPSLTLELHSASEKLETLNVKPNVELIKDSIIEFVGKYNRLIAEINILTSNKAEIVEEISYFTPEEKESAMKRLGTFYGDSTLSSLKSNLQSKMFAAYGSQLDLSIKLLSQLGISTNANSSTGVDASRLRGYLEIDEKKLEKAIAEQREDVMKFFGYDADGDVIIDGGLAYSIYEHLNPYTQRGGIFFAKMSAVEDKIKASEKRIVVYDKKLSQKEAELKRKYGMMEGTLRDLKKQSDSISNFNKSFEK